VGSNIEVLDRTTWRSHCTDAKAHWVWLVARSQRELGSGREMMGGFVSTNGIAWPKADPWAVEPWRPLFPRRADLERELALLERLFPAQWREENFKVQQPRHQLLWDLATPGGRTRLLDLAAELIRLMQEDSHCRAVSAQSIPMQGRLRWWNLYQPTRSEFLVAPILRRLGQVTWQPERAGHGADYKVAHRSQVLVAEVKRLCTSRRLRQLEAERAVATIGRSGPLFSPAENRAQAQEEARRLYRRVKYSADQLKMSATKAGASGSVPGVLFLDLDENNYLVNLQDTIREWMELPWAQPIDLIMWFDYRPREGEWGTIAKALYSRSGRALHAFARVYEPCSRGHVHVGKPPSGACEFDLPF
jgi:hypothetical protein